MSATLCHVVDAILERIIKSKIATDSVANVLLDSTSSIAIFRTPVTAVRQERTTLRLGNQPAPLVSQERTTLWKAAFLQPPASPAQQGRTILIQEASLVCASPVQQGRTIHRQAAVLYQPASPAQQGRTILGKAVVLHQPASPAQQGRTTPRLGDQLAPLVRKEHITM